MRLVWTADEPAADIRKRLAIRNFHSVADALAADGQWRIRRKMPVLIDDSGGFITEAFHFLFDVGVVRGSTRSLRTLETYAECLCDWLGFAERERLPWRRPSCAMLARYRDDLLGTLPSGVARSRPLSRRTVNLRLTVTIEFYKFLVEAQCLDPANQALVSRRLPELRRLRIRIDRRRPRALSIDQCRLLRERLRGVHRLIFQWALCTGLRTSSLVGIQLTEFMSLVRSRSSPRLLVVRAKGGKTVSVHVPQPLLDATLRYIDIERVLSQRSKAAASSTRLFLNSQGRAATAKAYYRAFCRARGAVRIVARPHQARATFATRVRDKLEKLARGGVDLDVVKIVQSLLAHADAQTTEQYLESIDVPSIDLLAILDELCGVALDAADPA